MSAILSRLEREADAYLIPMLLRLYERAQAPQLGLTQIPEPTDAMPIVDTIEDMRIVMKHPEIFEKDFALIDFFGHSRFNTNGKEWALRRSITQACYNDIGKSTKKTLIRENYKTNIEQINIDSPKYISNRILASSVSIFNNAFLSEENPEILMKMFDKIRKILKILQFISWNGSPNIETLEGIHLEVTYLLDLLDLENQRDPAFAELYKRFQDPSGNIQNYRPASEFIMNAFAGSETSATAILWAIDRLAALPQFQDDLAAADLESPEGEQRLETFINETLRYFPPLPLLTRRLSTDFELGDKQLKQGQRILLSIVGLHHSTKYWKDPHLFDPERPEFARKTYNKLAFVPFFSGPRICGGMRLARMEIREALKLFLKRFRISRTDEVIDFEYGLILRPANYHRLRLNYR